MVGAKPLHRQPSLWVVGASAARIGAHCWSGADFQQHRHHCCARRLPEAEGGVKVNAGPQTTNITNISSGRFMGITGGRE